MKVYFWIVILYDHETPTLIMYQIGTALMVIAATKLRHQPGQMSV